MATVKGTVKQGNTGHNSFEVVREGYVAVYTANGIIWRKVASCMVVCSKPNLRLALLIMADISVLTVACYLYC